MAWYIGIDIGTTNIKATAFSPESGVQAQPVSIPTPRYYPSPDCENYELDAEALWKTALGVLQKLLASLPSEEVRGISVSSLGESGVLVNSAVQPLCKAISWFDPRSQAEALELDRRLGRQKIYQITGQLSSYKFGITKLLWTRTNLPEVYSEAAMWLPINSYILYKLSGEIACDYSIAARTMAFDIRSLSWSEEMLQAAGIKPDFFPKAVPGGTSIGKILPSIANLLHLPHNVHICTGGHDHACAAVGTGAISNGCVLDSMGTSEATMMAFDHCITSEALYNAQVNIYPHCSPTLYRAMTSMQACGASINWFLEGIGASIADEACRMKTHPAVHLQNIAKAAPDSPEFHYFPFLRGSQNMPDSGGVFFGFRDSHGLPDFAKALLDGLCCEFTYLLLKAAEQFGTMPRSITAVGGPAQSDYFVRRKADISGIPVIRPSSQEAACFGAALLASIGCGDASFEQAAQSALVQESCFEPKTSPVLETLYGNYARRRPFIEECYR